VEEVEDERRAPKPNVPQTGGRAGIYISLYNPASVVRMRRDEDEGERQFEEALVLSIETGNMGSAP